MSSQHQHFEKLYLQSSDPWRVGVDWYERRKRNLLLACLPREQYQHALEAGCGNGHLSVELLQRCTRLTAVDFSARAIALCSARIRAEQRDLIQLETVDLPVQWPPIPEGGFDLIVVSEIAYYFDAEALSLFYRQCLNSLREEGHLLWCHWRHAMPDRLQPTDALHAYLDDVPQLRSLVRHVEGDFLMNIWELISQSENS